LGFVVANFHFSVRDAMTFLGFTPGEQEALFRTTAAVLHLGNIEFVPAANESSDIKNRDRLHIVAELLSVPSAKLAEAMTIRYNEIRGERIKVSW
jgi:myosin heavy subunit